MYCSACASPVTPGLKFCNRCGANLNKEETKGTSVANSLITGVVLIAIFGLGIMFGGAIALKQGGNLANDVIGIFMLFTFLIVGTAEIFLLRQLSRVLGAPAGSHQIENQAPLFQPAQSLPVRELRAVRDLPETIPSVTEGTTRTLEHSVRDISRS